MAKMIDKNETAPHTQQLIFQYLIKNEKYNGGVESKFFSNEDIQNTFKICQDHFKRYGSTPDIKLILTLLEQELGAGNPALDGQKNIIRKLLDFSELNTRLENDEVWLIEEYKEWIKRSKSKNKLNELIDKRRDGFDISKELGIIDEDDEDIIIESGEEAHGKTPFISKKVYDNLPKLLKDITKEFEGREKDVILTSCLTTMSAFFKDIHTLYKDGKQYTPNLYSFIVAPSASGKGVLLYTRDLIDNIIEEEYRKPYNEEVKLFDVADKKDKSITPIQKNIFIAGNSSYASFNDQLKNNNGLGIIIETEASVMVNAMKNDWGNYSANLLSAWAHESISKARVGGTGDKLVEICKPRISMALSGTMKSLIDLIGKQGTEDGLFSRILYYTFKADIKWDKSWKKIDYESKFKKDFGPRFYEAFLYYKDKPVEFSMTDEQTIRFDDIMEDLFKKGVSFNGDIYRSVVYRFGISALRIMMILSALRTFDKFIMFDGFKDIMVCSDIDFDVAMGLIKTYITHTEFLFDNVSKEGIIELKKNYRSDLLSEMSDRFKRGDMKNVGLKKYKITEKTVDRFLKELSIQGLIVKESEGWYKKIMVEVSS